MAKTATPVPRPDLDVLIIGAGLSGIDFACRLKASRPNARFAILEARDVIGGTWDLFRYPGIRSDSDMTTLGFPFQPWRGLKAIAPGDEILAYIQTAARDQGVESEVRYGHRVRSLAWSSQTARWTATIDSKDGEKILSAAFVYTATGYYDYAEAHTPAFPGLDDFKGVVAQPQFWPQDLNYAGKRVLVVGSGATAITLVPSLASTAAHVTMLQRTPTYLYSRPAIDGLEQVLRRILPQGVADWLVRWKNVLTGAFTYRLARRRPQQVRRALLKRTAKALGPGFNIDKDFTPPYAPWDQRICVTPDGDLFEVLRQGKASIVTDTIRSFGPVGVILKSGAAIEADIIVLATGLKLQMLGGISMTIDGKPSGVAGRLMYRGVMFDRIPNFALAFGYTNASWTLKCDLAARYICRLLDHMDRTEKAVCMPVAAPTVGDDPFVTLNSGYISRARALLPRQGDTSPWRLHQNYFLDKIELEKAEFDDGVLRFHAATTG